MREEPSLSIYSISTAGRIRTPHPRILDWHKISAEALTECLALLPRTDNYWFPRRSVADSLINSDFADFTVLQVYTGSRSAFRHSRIAGPQAERIGDLDSPRIASKRDV